MGKYITVDGGTTNTRISLVINGKITDTVKYHVGAGACHTDKKPLYSALREGIETLLSRNGISEGEIACVIASGMITSEGGLCNLPHLTAPVGLNELGAELYKTFFPEITTLPFCFIRGVKTVSEPCLELDMMRGEETELFGLLESPEADCVYVLPGSHTKIIFVDGEHRIIGFCTSLTGELIEAVASNTILKRSVSLNGCEIDRKQLMSGYTYAKENGLPSALFKVRVIDRMLSLPPSAAFGFFLGAVLQGDVDTVCASPSLRVVVGGKRELREPLAYLIRSVCTKSVIEADDETCANAASLGAVRIYKSSLIQH